MEFTKRLDSSNLPKSSESVVFNGLDMFRERTTLDSHSDYTDMGNQADLVLIGETSSGETSTPYSMDGLLRRQRKQSGIANYGHNSYVRQRVQMGKMLSGR